MRSYQYQIRNKHGDILDLTHQRYRTSLARIQRNYTLLDRLEQGGSVLLGDGKVQNKRIVLKYDYVGKASSGKTQVEDVYDFLNNLAGFFRAQDAPFYLENLVRDQRTRCIGDFEPSHIDGNEFLILKSGSIPLELLDSAWESIDEVDSGFVTLDSGDTMSISVPPYCEDIFPIIEVRSTADSPTIFAIETGSNDSGFSVFRTILLSDVTFPQAVGRIIRIDSVDRGRVTLDGRAAQEIIAFGYPPKFDRRNQVLRYYSSTGLGTVDCRIRYRVRTLY